MTSSWIPVNPVISRETLPQFLIFNIDTKGNFCGNNFEKRDTQTEEGIEETDFEERVTRIQE
jgi:hypothetical protein